MKGKRLTLENVINTTIFYVVEENGEKLVHFMGYSYLSDNEEEKPFRFLEYTFFYYPLTGIVENSFPEIENEWGQEYKQYEEDCSEERLLEIYRNYDNGNPPILIDLEDIKKDMPVGCYAVLAV